jgi:hypothetical protein
VIRDSQDYASWKDRKPLAAALRPIYVAATSAEAAAAALDAFEAGEEHHRTDRLQWPALPRRHVRQHTFGDRADQLRTHFGAICFNQMPWISRTAVRPRA